MQYLFGTSREGKRLADYCERRKADVEEAVRRWNPDELLATPDQEVIDYLVGTFSVCCPVLRHDEGTSTEPEPVDLPTFSDPRNSLPRPRSPAPHGPWFKEDLHHPLRR